MRICTALPTAMILAVSALAMSVSACNGEHTNHKTTSLPAGQKAESATASARKVMQPVQALGPKAWLECTGKDKDSNLCKAYLLIAGAQNQFGPQKQLEHLGAFGEVFYKSKKASAIDHELSKLDGYYAKAGVLISNQKFNSKLETLHREYDNCARLVIKSLGTKDDLDAVTDSCSFSVQRQADALFAEMGVQRPPKKEPEVFGLTWGATRARVMTEKGQPMESNQTSLTYKANVSGNDALVYLVFVGDKLARVTYVFEVTHTNNNLFTYDFELIDSELRKKYGAPAITGPFWRDNLYKDDRSHWGMAVATGRMYMSSEWTNATSVINHRLIGDNFSITHGIDYKAREFALAISQAAQKQDQSNL